MGQSGAQRFTAVYQTQIDATYLTEPGTHLLSTVTAANPNWPGYDATVLRVQMVDAPMIVTIRKRRLTGTAEHAGVRLQLLDAQGNLIHKWVSGTTPIQSVGWLVAEQIDQLVETCAPTGYKIATTIRFVVQADGTAQTIVMCDARTDGTDLPDTGDSVNLWLWLTVLAGSLALMIGLVGLIRERKRG